MAVYEYKALNESGRATAGIIDADTKKTARAKLRGQGLFPTELHEERGGGESRAKTVLRRGDVDVKKVFGRVSRRDMSVMTRQLATLLTAGIPMVEALGALVEQVENDRLKVVLSGIKEKVNEGSSLAAAMKTYPGVFDSLYTNMIGAGEASGALDVVLRRVADFLEDAVELQNRIRGAMAYPLIMTVVGGGVVIFLVTYIVPMFERMFKSMNLELPWITRFMLGTSAVIKGYWWLIIIVGVGGAVLFYTWKKSEAGRIVWDRLVLSLPLLGKTLRMIATARFARTLSTLLVSGVPLIQALEIVKQILGNVILEEAIENTRLAVVEGANIADPLKRSGQFPPIVTHMVATGERTGELEQMLEKVADAYDSEAKARIDLTTAFLQPIMILVMAVIVFMIALSILLPMLSMYTNLRTGG